MVANFRPGILEQFNIGYATLREVNPRIVMATVTGYGYHGAYAAFAALAPPMHAFGGLCASTGYPDGPPEQTFMTYGDVVSGMTAVPSILAALHERESTGVGRFIDVAMAEAMVAVLPEVVLHVEQFGEEARRRGNEEEGYAPHDCYPCEGRDSWVAIAAFDDHQWQAVTRVLKLDGADIDPRFASVEARWTNRADVDELMKQATRPWDAAELANRLQEAGVAAAPSRTAADLLVDEQFVADGFMQQIVQSELGEATMPALPWRIDSGEGSPRPMGPAPDFGEGSRELLSKILGIDDEAFEALHARGVVA